MSDKKMTVEQALAGLLSAYEDICHCAVPPHDETEVLYGAAAQVLAAHKTLTAALAGKDVESLACGHHKSLAIISAETGKFLYCDLCDARSAQRDAEEMEAKYAAQVEALEAVVKEDKE